MCIWCTRARACMRVCAYPETIVYGPRGDSKFLTDQVICIVESCRQPSFACAPIYSSRRPGPAAASSSVCCCSPHIIIIYECYDREREFSVPAGWIIAAILVYNIISKYSLPVILHPIYNNKTYLYII